MQQLEEVGQTQLTAVKGPLLPDMGRKEPCPSTKSQSKVDSQTPTAVVPPHSGYQPWEPLGTVQRTQPGPPSSA